MFNFKAKSTILALLLWSLVFVSNAVAQPPSKLGIDNQTSCLINMELYVTSTSSHFIGSAGFTAHVVLFTLTPATTPHSIYDNDGVLQNLPAPGVCEDIEVGCADEVCCEIIGDTIWYIFK